jgi:hypothetical protein
MTSDDLARAIAISMAMLDTSAIVTSQPLDASQMALRPVPPAMSRALPGVVNNLALSTSHDDGSVGQGRSV